MRYWCIRNEKLPLYRLRTTPHTLGTALLASQNFGEAHNGVHRTRLSGLFKSFGCLFCSRPGARERNVLLASFGEVGRHPPTLSNTDIAKTEIQ